MEINRFNTKIFLLSRYIGEADEKHDKPDQTISYFFSCYYIFFSDKSSPSVHESTDKLCTAYNIYMYILE